MENLLVAGEKDAMTASRLQDHPVAAVTMCGEVYAGMRHRSN
jgi:hypothetical protein